MIFKRTETVNGCHFSITYKILVNFKIKVNCLALLKLITHISLITTYFYLDPSNKSGNLL